MAYALRPGLSYCRVGERLLFLDLRADRYLCLQRPVETAFLDLATGYSSAAEEPTLLLRSGIVVPALEMRLGACSPAPVPAGSLPETSPPPVGGWHIARALARLASAALSLRWLGLNSSIGSLEARKHRIMASRPSARMSQETAGLVLQVSSAFVACDTILGSKDKCLPRSIAAANRLLDIGLIPHLVIGVRLDPFHAHAWTQWGDQLVNERMDAVRGFTPILVL